MSNTKTVEQPKVAPAQTGKPLITMDSAILREVELKLEATIGELHLTVAELLALKSGSVVRLNTTINDLVELQLNRTPVARGELVTVDDSFGLRIVEIIEPA